MKTIFVIQATIDGSPYGVLVHQEFSDSEEDAMSVFLEKEVDLKHAIDYFLTEITVDDRNIVTSIKVKGIVMDGQPVSPTEQKWQEVDHVTFHYDDAPCKVDIDLDTSHQIYWWVEKGKSLVYEQRRPWLQRLFGGKENSLLAA